MRLVVAGSFQQFADWCRKEGISKHDPSVAYVREVPSLFGHAPDTEIVYWGTYDQRPDWTELDATIKARFAHKDGADA